MSLAGVAGAARDLGRASLSLALRVPYSAPVVAYVRRSYQNDPFRTLLEVAVIIWAAVYALRPKRPDKDRLTEQEVDALVAEWKPEPLVPAHPENAPQPNSSFSSSLRAGISLWKQRPAPTAPAVVASAAGLRVRLTSGERLLFWSSGDFLGLQNSEAVVEKAVAAVRTYGVGACGPSGFYGTLDVHMALEDEIARALGTEAAIIYAQGFMAVASVIPAFAKRGDILVADEAVSLAIQTGLEISRSHIHYYRHNDMADLERVLRAIDARRGPVTRRFIVTEGVFAKTGALCPLPQLLYLKEKYRFRLIVDESISFGVLGRSGRGISEHWGVPASRIDIIAGTFSNALGSSGGFCAGSRFVVDHQRLSSQAYCFSAALPALLTTAASHALGRMLSEPALVVALRRNTAIFDAIVRSDVGYVGEDAGASLPAVGDADGNSDATLPQKEGDGVEFIASHEWVADDAVAEGKAALASRSAPSLPHRGTSGATRFAMLGDPGTPVRIVRLARRLPAPDAEVAVIDAVVAALRARGYLVARAQYVEGRDRAVPPPSLKVCVSGGFTDAETADFARALVSTLALAEVPRDAM